VDIIEEKLQLFIGMSGPLLYYFLSKKIINKVRIIYVDFYTTLFSLIFPEIILE
jgi:hypothetical protein